MMGQLFLLEANRRYAENSVRLLLSLSPKKELVAVLYGFDGGMFFKTQRERDMRYPLARDKSEQADGRAIERRTNKAAWWTFAITAIVAVIGALISFVHWQFQGSP